jgi:uncharacterized protein
MDLIVEELFVYPIKSLGGIRIKSAILEERGFKYDRRWMLRDKEGNFLTQRNLASMALFQVEIEEDVLKVFDKAGNLSPLKISFEPNIDQEKYVRVWDDTCLAKEVGKEVNEWFSQALGFQAELVYMPEHSNRPSNPLYTFKNERVSFADAMPYLITGYSSLNDLNSKAEYPVNILRFRPNIVFSGGKPFAEDNWKKIKIGDNVFYGVKQCGRCVVTTIDQETAEKGKEPLKTLSAYRFNGKSVIFGKYLTVEGSGTISLGDKIEILE